MSGGRSFFDHHFDAAPEARANIRAKAQLALLRLETTRLICAVSL